MFYKWFRKVSKLLAAFFFSDLNMPITEKIIDVIIEYNFKIYMNGQTGIVDLLCFQRGCNLTK